MILCNLLLDLPTLIKISDSQLLGKSSTWSILHRNNISACDTWFLLTLVRRSMAIDRSSRTHTKKRWGSEQSCRHPDASNLHRCWWRSRLPKSWLTTVACALIIPACFFPFDRHLSSQFSVCVSSFGICRA